jgi:hypothetical protein
LEDTRESTEDLQSSASHYINFRHRFISTYKRDKGNSATKDEHLIAMGNKTAHFGNIKADANLYPNAAIPSSDVIGLSKMYPKFI